MTKKIEDEDTKRKFLTYFLLFFPTLILAAIPDLINGSLMVSLSIKLLLIFYQFTVIKNFVDVHYE